MSDHPAIREFIQGTIRAEKARQGITFTELSSALLALGIDQTSTNLSTKVGRGNMSAQLFLAIMKVLNQQELSLDTLQIAKTRKTRAAAPIKAELPVKTRAGKGKSIMVGKSAVMAKKATAKRARLARA